MLRFLLCFLTFGAVAQIPTGTWRTHNNYVNLKGLEVVEKRVYAFSDNGFFYFDKINKKTVTLSKSDGLAEANVASIRYSPSLKKLLIAYTNGNLDLAVIDADGQPEEVQNISFIKNTNSIQTSRHINAIEFQGDFAYLACDFGLVVLDTRKAEIRETYQNLGSGGAAISINKIAFARDSIFLSTNSDILGAAFSANVNLQYFGNWRKVSDSGLFQPADYPVAPLIVNPVEMGTDTDGKIWIADGENGLIANWEGAFKAYSPNGTRGQLTNLLFHDSKTYGFTNTVGNVFENEAWHTVPAGELPPYSSAVTDSYGFRWQIVFNGVRVTDTATGQTRLFTTGRNAGNLPSSSVNSLVIDHEGIVWVGTNDGIAAAITSRDIFSRQVDAYTPYNSRGRRILLQEVVRKIVVDGGNRKWIGTNNGLSLFAPAVDELLMSFNEANSPLPANEITDLSMDTTRGEIFVLSDGGLLSYQTDASSPKEDFGAVSIFPNPVRPDFQGVLTISGLRENSTVKITDAAGRLVYETRSNGGTASWNLGDSPYGRTLSGIFMVFTVATDGSESFAGKVAVIK